MKLKNAVQRSIVIVTIIVLSIIIGYIYSIIGHQSDLKKHPREYSEIVEKYSAEYGVPEYIIYAVILEESGFVSNYVSETGEIGLMQLSEETFSDLLTITKDNLEVGILYDPDTNVKYGTYYLSHLYIKYNRWSTVYAAYHTSEAVVDDWMSFEENLDESGNLAEIPDEEAAQYCEIIESQAEMYKELYY